MQALFRKRHGSGGITHTSEEPPLVKLTPMPLVQEEICSTISILDGLRPEGTLDQAGDLVKLAAGKPTFVPEMSRLTNAAMIA